MPRRSPSTPQGRLWVATAAYTYTGTDGVYVVDHAGAAPIEVITGLRTPLGLLWYSGSLYVASTSQVDAYSDFNGTRFLAHRTILTLPTGSGEVNELVLAPDGRMLIGITASCDHCTPSLADLRVDRVVSPERHRSPGVRHANPRPGRARVLPRNR